MPTSTEAVAVCVERHRRAPPTHGMALPAGAPNGLVAARAPRLLDVVLDNLVENAIRHAGEGAQVNVARPRPGAARSS